MSIKERVQGLCKEKGITSKALESTLELGQGYISKLDKSTPNMSKLKPIADYFGVTVDYLINGETSESYYLNEETAAIAQDIYENKELRVLFDAARTAKPEDLKTTYDMLLALKRKEEGYSDD